MSTWIDQAFELAKSTQKNSYSPYSKFPVAAVVKFKGKDQLYSGCNIENASFGLTVCAERTAIFKAVSEMGGKPVIEGILILTKTSPASPPCGACLQVIREFAPESATIVLMNNAGEKEIYRLKDLLPVSFGPESMK